MAPLMLALLLIACSGGDTAPPPTSTNLQPRADLFAATAQRALVGTPFETLGQSGVGDLVIGLCEGLGVGAIGPTIDGLELSGTEAERKILVEVLTIGMVQVCPDRAPVDLAGFYLDAVARTAEAAGALAAFEQGDVIRAGPVVCDALTDGSGVEAALLAVIESLFAVRADSIDVLVGLIDGDQGLVAGAVLASATAILCPEYADEVESFMAGL